MWNNLERPIAHLIVSIDHHLSGGGGVRDTFLLVGESFLKRCNLSR